MNDATYRTQRTDTPHGISTLIVTPSGHRASLLATNAVINHPKLRAFAILDTQLAAESDRIAARHADGFTGNALRTEQDTAAARGKMAVGSAVAEGRAYKATLQARRAESLSFNRAAEPSAPLRSDLRAWLLSHTGPQRIVLLADADYSLAVSVLEAGRRVAGVDDAVWGAFEDRSAALIHVHKTGTDARHSLQPTLESPLAVGVDPVAAAAEGLSRVNDLKAEFEIIDQAESYLKAVINALVLLTNKPASYFLDLE